MKQSAVEFLVQLLNNFNENFKFAFKEEIEQAKKIEKQQIIDAYDVQWNANINDGKQYYKETFKTK
ncbi:hypothetical protein [Flavobacterium sp.]|uniref:hypothetical protein n=1 Tax=Flavobacterium sp. TaxID=239 RepID=UPI00333FE439